MHTKQAQPSTLQTFNFQACWIFWSPNFHNEAQPRFIYNLILCIYAQPHRTPPLIACTQQKLNHPLAHSFKVWGTENTLAHIIFKYASMHTSCIIVAYCCIAWSLVCVLMSAPYTCIPPLPYHPHHTYNSTQPQCTCTPTPTYTPHTCTLLPHPPHTYPIMWPPNIAHHQISHCDTVTPTSTHAHPTPVHLPPNHTHTHPTLVSPE